MKALMLVGEEGEKRPVHESRRCIGCGLCAVACKRGNITMKAVSHYEKPKGLFGYMAKYGPRYLYNMRKVKAERRENES